MASHSLASRLHFLFTNYFDRSWWFVNSFFNATNKNHRDHRKWNFMFLSVPFADDDVLVWRTFDDSLKQSKQCSRIMGMQRQVKYFLKGCRWQRRVFAHRRRYLKRQRQSLNIQRPFRWISQFDNLFSKQMKTVEWFLLTSSGFTFWVHESVKLESTVWRVLGNLESKEFIVSFVVPSNFCLRHEATRDLIKHQSCLHF